LAEECMKNYQVKLYQDIFHCWFLKVATIFRI
jgi:hypothetical protein